jgi:hypothetical protein
LQYHSKTETTNACSFFKNICIFLVPAFILFVMMMFPNSEQHQIKPHYRLGRRHHTDLSKTESPSRNLLSLATEQTTEQVMPDEAPTPLVVYLVVSHCKQDLLWLANLTTVFNIRDIVIYSKCGHSVIGAPSNSRVVILPNVGRCDHTYTHYISELNATAGVVLFVKDTTHVHHFHESRLKGINLRRSYEAMVETAAGPSQFACRQYIEPAVGISNEAISNYLVKYSLSKYNMSFHNYTSKQVEPFSIYPAMSSWTQALGVPLRQPLTPVCYGGIFAVSVQRLLAIDRHVWVALKSSLSRAENIEEGHFMERSWAGLLSLEPTPTAVNNHYLNDTALCFRRNICGYRGHIVRSREVLKKYRLCARVPRLKISRAIRHCPMVQKHKHGKKKGRV